jgi:hypothetical protein
VIPTVEAATARFEAKSPERPQVTLASAKARDVVLGGWRGGPAPTDADREGGPGTHCVRRQPCCRSSACARATPIRGRRQFWGSGSALNTVTPPTVPSGAAYQALPIAAAICRCCMAARRNASRFPVQPTVRLCSPLRPRYIHHAAARRARLDLRHEGQRRRAEGRRVTGLPARSTLTATIPGPSCLPASSPRTTATSARRGKRSCRAGGAGDRLPEAESCTSDRPARREAGE